MDFTFERFRRGVRDRWAGYVFECVDGSLYIGSTSDLDRRFREHVATPSKVSSYASGSKFVRERGGPKRLLELFFCHGKEQARAWEKEQCFILHSKFPKRDVYTPRHYANFHVNKLLRNVGLSVK